jgi:hypothetical protein
MQQAILYFLGRFADILSTWLNVRLGGYEVEASPVGRWSMERFGFGGYIVINLLISTLIFLMIRYLKRPWLMTGSTVVFWGFAIWNTVIYLLAV